MNTKKEREEFKRDCFYMERKRRQRNDAERHGEGYADNSFFIFLPLLR